MTDKQEELLAAYTSLDKASMYLLEILSTRTRPMSRSQLVKCANRGKLYPLNGPIFTLRRLFPLIRELRSHSLVVDKHTELSCESSIREIVARRADLEGRFSKWDEVVKGVAPRQRTSYSTYWSYSYRESGLIEDLRIAVYRNDVADYEDLLYIWNRDFSYRKHASNPVIPIFNNPFDAEWAKTREPSIRNEPVYSIALDAVSSFTQARGPIELLGVIAEEGGTDSGSARDLLAWHDMFAGAFDAAVGRIPAAAVEGRDLLRVWQLCARGDWKAAALRYGEILKDVRKATRRRDTLLEPFPSALFLISSLGSRDPVRLREASKYIQAALRQYSSEQHHSIRTLYRLLRWSLDVTEGKVASHRGFEVTAEEFLSLAPYYRIFALTALCWVDVGKARDFRQEALRLEARARTAGYRWIASELLALLDRMDRAKRRNGDLAAALAELGTVPLVDAVSDEEPWERQLSALAVLGKVDRPVKRKAASVSRLTWRLESDEERLGLHPYEQRQGKTGRWSAGRAVALKRLHVRKNTAFLTDQDVRICESIEEFKHSRGYRYLLPLAKALDELVGHPLVFRKDAPSKRVDVVRSEPRLQVLTKGTEVRIQLVPRPPETGNVVGVLESPTRLSVTAFRPEHRELYDVLGPDGVQAPAKSKERIVQAVAAVSSLVTVHSDIAGEDGGSLDVEADPRPHFHLTPYDDGLRAEPLVQPFVDEGPSYSPGEGGKIVFAIVNGKRSHTRRDPDHEMRLYNAAVSFCESLRDASWDGAAWVLSGPHRSLELVDELHRLGDNVVVKWPKGESFKIKHHADAARLSLKIRKTRDWFKIDGGVKVDEGVVLGLRELLDLMDGAEGRFVPLGDRGFLALENRFRRRVEELAHYVDRHGKKGLRFHPSRTHALEGLVEEAGSVDADSNWADRLRRFREAQALDPVLPSTLQAELRDYQVEGFRWASRLAAWGAGACLADDMGLGKTLQALTVALERAPTGPTLVVAPTSVCPNWIDEARRFTPTLNPFQFGPGNRAKMIESLRPFDVMICSYGLLHQETDRLAGVEWVMIVLDEAQAIKNRQTLRSRAAMRLNGAFRMITTGTPIENHLGELWNLFHFINPGLLGSFQSFAKSFAAAIHRSRGAGARRRLKGLIRPFILRRTKSAVLEELPPRTEITIRVKMSDDERALYEAARRHAVENAEAAGEEGGKGHLKILAEIMRLRRACCHPSLIAPGLGLKGSKLESFGYTVADLITGGHKALVFSQFVDHLKIVRSYLDKEGISYRYLDGSTPAGKRKREVDAFQAGQGDLFLISLRAGGQGLNLTAADYVLHLDPWWNPAVEDQASDRAHRIGQTRPVTIYRFVMKDTIEARIVDLHASKRDLADGLLQGTDMSGKMSADELLRLIRAG